MKRVLQMIFIAMIAFFSNLAMAQTFTYPVKGEQGFSISEKTRDGLHVNYNLGQFSLRQLNYRGEDMAEISISGMVLPNIEGCPDLPVESRMLAIPQGANARLNIINVESEVVNDVNIAPALRIQAESEEPESNYVKNRDVYEKNAFYPEQPFTIDRSSIRGVDVVAVSISPFQYNPVTKELRVYTNIELSVSFEGGNGHFGDDRLRSPYWDPILAAELMNYDQLPVIDYTARMQQWLRDDADGAEYLIITPNNDGWAEYANQLKNYRTRQGILTKVYRLDEMPASSIDEMKAWFHNAYNTWTIPPVAVLLFGDHGTDMSQYIPAETVSHPQGGSCISDNGYSDPTGDNLPDMVFSRLVAANATEAQMMVSKQIEYEFTNPNMDASTYDHPITALGWQTERWFQLCSEVVGGYWRNQGKHPVRINEIYELPAPADIWSSASNTSTVVNYFGPNGQGYIPASPNELGGWTGGTGADVVNAINNGAMMLQHRDHGSYQRWGQPVFSNSNVNQMTNVGKLTFVNTINCKTGTFDYSSSYDSDCLIEAFMRRTYNGQNAGAVGCLGPTETSYSFVNDTYVWGLMDQYDPDFLPNYGPYANYYGNWQPAFGNVAGKYFLQQSSWSSGSSVKVITYQMFTAHCDAFLRLYTQVPRTMDVAHTSAIVAGGSSISVSAPEGCTISLVKANLDGGWDILAVATATGSSQTVEFEPQVPPTVIHIVVTGQDYLRYEDTIEVVPAAGSYIAVDSYSPNATPVNQQTSLSVNFRNVGLDATSGTTYVTINSNDDRLTIIDGIGQFGALGGNQVVSLENEFSFIIAQNVPDDTRFQLNVTMTCGEETWAGVVNVKAVKAVPVYVGMSWAKIFDAGETLTLTATFKNNGHYTAANTVAYIASPSQYLTIVNETYEVGTLEANSQVECTFDVIIASDCPDTEQIPITFTMDADGDLHAEGSEILKNIIITVEANPEAGGSVSGGGKMFPGSTCTITAAANVGYVFNSWTMNGVAVSYFPTYNFTVSDDAIYEANFQAVSNGVAIGDGTATKDHLPSYSLYCYSLSQQIYTAEEMNLDACDISSVSFFNAGYYKTRNYDIYMVNTDKAAFDSSSDWITVTEENRVFSGSVSMDKGVWTTIYFSTPFSYDGASNVVLIVDDNTGSYYYNNMSCRVFPSENEQALYIYSDGTDYDPTSPTGYSGYRSTVKNQVIFGIASYDYAVTVSVGPDGGGTVSGGGLCYLNQPVTLTATPNEGYVFNNWTKNGEVVSCLSQYNLNVTESAEYVANFQEVTNGFAVGDATYTNSYLPTYSYYPYSLSQQIYTADEMDGEATQISSISFFNTGSNRIRNMSIYMVYTDKTTFENSSDWITVTEADRVFNGSVTMAASGWTNIIFDVPFLYNGTSNFVLVVDDNTNSWYSGISCRTFDTEGSQSLRICGSGTDYDPYNPTDYTGTLMSVKNQVIFHWPCTVTATANPTEGGTVSGSGSYAIGATCTLTATPNAGYYFLNWTKDGEVVSYDATYSFTVNDDSNLVANFVEGGSTCTISFDLYDSYGNGWNGNKLVVDYGDGNTEELTLPSGSSISYSREIATGSLITLSWITGSSTYQCSFDIKFENGVLIYHGAGLNSSFQQELYINCAVATAPHVITVIAEPEEGGTVGGAGTFDGGSGITVTAAPNAGYSFIHWKENGTVVSSDANYSFIVSSDRNLVAFFSLPLTVSVTTNLAVGGMVTGAGTFDYGNTCTLTAIPNEGYLFLHWSKNGEVVSCNASYSFAVTEDVAIEAVFMPLEGTLIGQGESTNSYLPSCSYWNYTMSQQIYTPNEIGGAGNITSISYYNGGTTKTRTYDIYMVHTDKIAFSGSTDWIAVTEADRVYSGSVNMAKGYWNTIVLDMPFAYDGTSNLAVIVDDNTGSWSSGLACRVFNAQGSQATYVYSDDTNYDPYNPSSYSGTRYSVKNQIILGITSSQTFTKEIDAYTSDGGYYLLSFPTMGVSPEEVEHMLDNSYDLYAFDESQPKEWRNYKTGTFNLEPGKGYLYANSNDVDLSLVGSPYNGNGEVTLSKTGDAETAGWNLVGNPFAVTAYIDRAFYVMNDDGSEIVPAERDYIEPMEGVFVIAESDGEPLTFSTTAPSKSPRLVLNLSGGPSTGSGTANSGTAIIDRAIIRFTEGSMLPKLQIKESSSKLYIKQDGKDYAVVNSGEEGEMLVGFKAEQSGTYTLNFSNENVDFSYLHLIDTLTGVDIDLLEMPSYSFKAKITDKTERFKVEYATEREE